eukprot:6031378-Amphidinium_carterae.1
MEECVLTTQQELEALIYTVAGVRNRQNDLSITEAARISRRSATPEEKQADVMLRIFASSLREIHKLGLDNFMMSPKT